MMSELTKKILKEAERMHNYTQTHTELCGIFAELICKYDDLLGYDFNKEKNDIGDFLLKSLKKFNEIKEEEAISNLTLAHKINCKLNKPGNWQFCDCGKH